MSDVFSPEFRSHIMAKISSKNTRPELIVRKLLHSKGYRFRLHRKDLPGNPDIVLPKYKKIIFVHGCFWHSHNCKFGTRIPKTNTEYWVKKLKNNSIRDKINIEKLISLGWKVLIIWECTTKDIDRTNKVLDEFFM